MSLATVMGMPGHRRKTPLRTLQVDDRPWEDFGKACTITGRPRPDTLRDVMDWVSADPELWAEVRKTADARGETMRAAVLSALRLYLDR